VSFEAGHALLSENPFYRFERRVHAAVAEARALHAGRHRRRGRLAESELRRIIRDGSITTLFQPVVEMASGEVVGYEALSRGPLRSRLESPRALFALSDRVGASRDLDRACRIAALRRSATGLRGPIFVNVRPETLTDPEWTGGTVGSLLEENGREATDVVLEVSERCLDGDLGAVAAATRALRERGFRIALDDAGTGYASLVTVETLRPDFLKVDASLVRGIDGSLILQEVVLSLARIGARVGAHVVGVGVEREDEARCLRDVGASLAQGFLYAVPAPAEAWTRGRASP
jgi:EAL domain-containing protein (putative c-di-GMP-specific phosphodiesterase class I)